MKHLDDLPKRDSNHDTQEVAETAFRTAVSACGLFVVQQEDRSDYGTDYQIEARDGEKMTNIRVHVQLKGTESDANTNGTVSRSVARSNLNYLLAQPASIYVCCHLPSERLLIRYAEDVYREYEHLGKDWIHQESITVKFNHLFDEKFQHSLKERVLLAGRSSRDRRLQFTTTPPEQIPKLVQKTLESIEIPADAEQAKEILTKLYETGNDEVISNSFEHFSVVLGALPGAMDLAYMAETNLGINSRDQFDKSRVRKGIDVLQETIKRGDFHTGSLLYSIGNSWLALSEYEKAQDVYHDALGYLVNPEIAGVAAQCCKNMGTVLEKLGKENTAPEFYERALKLDPNLSEAHYALAIWYRRKEDFTKVLEHLDQVIRRKGTAIEVSAVQGWRIEALFNIEDYDAAFREVNNLISEADKFDWIWPWCVGQVSYFGKVSLEVVQKALQFWRVYLSEYPEDIEAERERLLCYWYLRSVGKHKEVGFAEFKKMVIEVIERGEPDPAFLFDRLGHWAQYDENWIVAEQWYRKAYDMFPERYGYCLGTALNFLNRYTEALPILLCQAEGYQSDAMCWFQVAVAREGLNDIEGSVSAYKLVLELDADYELAWFNLGGIYWNSKDNERATKIWKEAVVRFPAHDLTKKLRRDMPFLFKEGVI